MGQERALWIVTGDLPGESARALAGSTGGLDERRERTALLIDAPSAAKSLALGTRTL